MDRENEHHEDEKESEGPPFSPLRMPSNPVAISSPNLELEQASVASGSVYSESDESEVGEESTESEEGEQPFSLKRPAEDALAPRSFKRQKGVLNAEYLELLNRDIEDAAHRVSLEDDADTAPSQLGMTFWTPLEKKLFFEALARLGRDDLPGIAAMVGTKSVVEVNHYLHTLRQAQRMRQRNRLRPALEFSEYPAAVELSQQCCYALDEAADAVSVRQERKEEQREETRWGTCWDITPKIARRLEKGENLSEDRQLMFASLFNSPAWLKLSERIFMNSSIPGDNWHFIEDHAPSMWATTFEDFYSLALSYTRRLVQTTIFMSMSRIKAKRELISTTREIVRRKDVEAAVASLGLDMDSNEFWIKCARRLRLEIYDEPPDRDEEGDEEPLTYEEVESALSDEQIPATDAEHIKEEEEEDTEGDISLKSDMEDISSSSSSEDEEEAAIKQEAKEVLHYSAADFPETYRTKKSLTHRIWIERQSELFAEAFDQHQSSQAEAEMWEILQRKPPTELPKVQDPGPVQRSKLDVESIYPIGRDWRAKTRFHGEWESTGGSRARGDEG